LKTPLGRTKSKYPATPGGRIRALGFARMGARGRRRGPIPAMCQYQGSPVSVGTITSIEKAMIVSGAGAQYTKQPH
jgi:hypothetical protein